MLQELNLWAQKLLDGMDLAHNFYYEHKKELFNDIKKIAFVGMGASEIAGRILKTFLDKKTNIPSFIIDYPDLPNFVDTSTLVIVVSYSGNTWETLQVLKKSSEKFIPTIVISHGGKTIEIAESKNIPFIIVPKSIQPRTALGNFLGIMLGLFNLIPIMPCKDIFDTFVKQAETYIPKFTDETYFSEFLESVKNYDYFHIWGVSADSSTFAYRAQTQFNENSKVQAVSAVLPECTHNLLVGFTKCKNKPFLMLFYSEFLPTKMIKLIESTEKILQECGVLLYKPPILGDNWEAQLFNMLLWSDFASYYLGKKRGIEIEPVKVIDKLKAMLKEKNR